MSSFKCWFICWKPSLPTLHLTRCISSYKRPNTRLLLTSPPSDFSNTSTANESVGCQSSDLRRPPRTQITKMDPRRNVVVAVNKEEAIWPSSWRSPMASRSCCLFIFIIIIIFYNLHGRVVRAATLAPASADVVQSGQHSYEPGLQQPRDTTSYLRVSRRLVVWPQ